MALERPPSSGPRRPARRAVPSPSRLLLLGVLLALALVAWRFRDPIEARLMQAPTLANDAPPASLIEEMIARAPSPAAAIVEAWNTGKIVHREVAIQQIGRSLPRGNPLPRELEAILLSGALDPDQNVREAALSGLTAWTHPALSTLAVRQLSDPDPEMRRLGLHVLRRSRTNAFMTAVIPLLDDPQADIAALALHTLGRWADRDFGVKLSDAVATEDARSGLRTFAPDSKAKVQAAAENARSWWQNEGRTAAPGDPVPPVPAEATRNLRPLPAGDFELPALDGTRVRLWSLRGKVVLLNFWTTWCTACLGEIPALIELRKRHGPELAILGISLDNLADAHGHVGGHPPVESVRGTGDPVETGEDERAHDRGETHPSLGAIRRKVEAAVRRRGINYPVLIDAANDVGGRFNGGELPTTVIVDRDGFIRRRFVGPRDVGVFEAMIAEAARPGR